jgi:hypothetical protein
VRINIQDEQKFLFNLFSKRIKRTYFWLLQNSTEIYSIRLEMNSTKRFNWNWILSSDYAAIFLCSSLTDSKMAGPTVTVLGSLWGQTRE